MFRRHEACSGTCSAAPTTIMMPDYKWRELIVLITGYYRGQLDLSKEEVTEYWKILQDFHDGIQLISARTGEVSEGVYSRELNPDSSSPPYKRPKVDEDQDSSYSHGLSSPESDLGQDEPVLHEALSATGSKRRSSATRSSSRDTS